MTERAGVYYVNVCGYSAFSGVTLKASYTVSGGGSGALRNGVAVTSQSGSRSQELSYTVAVPVDTHKLTMASSGGTGDADPYVKLGSVPTISSCSCRPCLTGNNETCTFNAPAGTYYIKLRGYSAFSGVSLKASR